MFRHVGKARTISHNLKIASLLSFVAGIVNVTGFLAIHVLTTNVTGHFAYLMEELLQLHIIPALVFLLYLASFLAGSFASAFIVEMVSRKNERNIFIVPVLLESMILLLVALTGNYLVRSNPELLAFSLLFAMGLQNSLVTQISGAIVRTTHLTGLFTDLGIELSQLFFYNTAEQKQRLHSSINLRSSIIGFFFAGGVTGGMLYPHIHLWTLSIASAILIGGLWWDSVLLKIKMVKRKLQFK